MENLSDILEINKYRYKKDNYLKITTPKNDNIDKIPLDIIILIDCRIIIYTEFNSRISICNKIKNTIIKLLGENDRYYTSIYDCNSNIALLTAVSMYDKLRKEANKTIFMFSNYIYPLQINIIYKDLIINLFNYKFRKEFESDSIYYLSKNINSTYNYINDLSDLDQNIIDCINHVRSIYLISVSCNPSTIYKFTNIGDLHYNQIKIIKLTNYFSSTININYYNKNGIHKIITWTSADSISLNTTDRITYQITDEYIKLLINLLDNKNKHIDKFISNISSYKYNKKYTNINLIIEQFKLKCYHEIEKNMYNKYIIRSILSKYLHNFNIFQF